MKDAAVGKLVLLAVTMILQVTSADVINGM